MKAKRKLAVVRPVEAEQSGGESQSNLCGFEGAKRESAKARSAESLSKAEKLEGSREADRWPNRRYQKGGSEGHLHCRFPVTIA